jgi:hypothetical protein
MSEDKIPAPDGQDKSHPQDAGLEDFFRAWVPCPDVIVLPFNRPATPKRRRKPQTGPSTYSPIEHTLYSVQAFGFTHPTHGHYLMVPKEFQAILLLESKAVSAVVWEVMLQTVGWEGNGPGGRREWAPLTVRHFERTRILSHRHATSGIADALARGYIERRLVGARRYEYRLRWKGSN